MTLKKMPGLVLGLLLTINQAVVGQSDEELTKETVSRALSKAHLQFLASDELKGRDTPSPELDIAARYLVTQLSSYGVKAHPDYPNYLQEVPLTKVTASTTTSLNVNQLSLSGLERLASIGGGNANLKAQGIFLDYGTADEFQDAQVSGKIVFVRCGYGDDNNAVSWFQNAKEKNARALEAGAVAIVELYVGGSIPWPLVASYLGKDQVRLGHDLDSDRSGIPHLWLADADYEVIDALNEKKKSKVALEVQGIGMEESISYNVIGTLEGSDEGLKKEYVTYTAHYDHVGIGQADEDGDNIYNGARDNAFGTTTVLSIAQNIARYPTKRSAVFVLFCGEEKGLLGSEWYVSNSVVPLSSTVFCFNVDNGGYNDVTKATTIGLERTTASKAIKTACEAFGLEAIEDPAPEQGLFDRSDNVHFARGGVPAPTLGMGFTAFDEEILTYYHQPRDQSDNLDYDYVHQLISSYVYAARIIANNPERPFWTEGDFYYNAGVELYKK